MLFNSYEFIFLYMPVVFAGFFLIAQKTHQGAIAWLGLASIFFYAYWSLYALPVIVASICLNYWLGFYLSNHKTRYRQYLLIFSISLNLFALIYFKYADFFIANTNILRIAMGMEPLSSLNIILPIGISFFTFTQIAFLIDSYQGKVNERSFLQYVLFVSFFPHLLAGPVLHHKQMMPQFSDPKTFVINYEKIELGIIIFTIGLAKKILLADPMGGYADILFNSAQSGTTPNFGLSWLGSFSYTFQLYFDFSGYSDMAVGIALLFGIWLPFNFNSPFKATSIIDFWQRWHITLTKYVGEYLYVPITLKLMRLGFGKPVFIEVIYSLVFPTMLIFLILGIWHGANWTYVVFGGMHGTYIVINHIWRKIFPPSNKKSNKVPYERLKKLAGWALTFLAVNISFVMFRANSFSTAIEIYKGMLGVKNGFDFSNIPSRVLLGLLICLTIVVSLSNTLQLSTSHQAKHLPNFNKDIKSIVFAFYLGVLIFLTVLKIGQQSVFLYFQF